MAAAGVRMESAKGRTDPPGRRVQPKEGAGLRGGYPRIFPQTEKGWFRGKDRREEEILSGVQSRKKEAGIMREGEGVR